ncbi:MAG: tetratricopeptide repeat protein [Alphaproteobacteria bacterium]
MKLASCAAMAGILLCAQAAAGETEFQLCQGDAENPIIRAANCDIAIRLGGLSTDQMVVALYNRGQAYLTSQKPAPALDDFDAVLKLNPDDLMALFTRGIARRQLKQYDGAIADFDQLLALNYQPAAKIFLNRSMVYHLKGDEEKTLADLHKAHELDPQDPVIKDRLWKTERLYKQQGR